MTKKELNLITSSGSDVDTRQVSILDTDNELLQAELEAKKHGL